MAERGSEAAAGAKEAGDMALPRGLALPMMQTLWASQLDPVLANPANAMSILKNVALINGVTVINHGLGQTQQGWILTDIQGSAMIYRSAPFNSLTLTLTSSAAVTCSIGVF
jgi:hypothetical protein